MSGMFRRNLARRRGKVLQQARIGCALITIPPDTWPGSIHLGPISGYGLGSGAELRGMELLYAHPAHAVVLRLALAGPGNAGFDSAVLRSLTRLTGTPIAHTSDMLDAVTYTVCGQENVQTRLSAPGLPSQQAYFTAHGTHVSIASWRYPLDSGFFAALALESAPDLGVLKDRLRVTPLILDIPVPPSA